MPTHNSGIDLSALSPINLTISILTNIASSIVEHHAQNLHGTVLGKALKLAGLIEPNFDDRLKSLLRETLQAFFEAHPGYKYQEIVDFFADAVVTKALADAILESTPINHEALQARLDAYLISLPQARWQLQSARIVGEFLATYRYVRRRHFDDGQVALIDAIEANGAELQQARGLLEKLYAKVEHELSVLQRMKAHFRSVNLDDFPTATPEQVHAFYTGRYPLKWELIKADAIIKRDQEAAVLDSLNSAPAHLEFVCITGQAGDGKSSFAWEIALQTASRLGCWLLQVRSNQTPEAWEMLENAVLETGRRPLVVLVDDVFRDDSFVQALLNMRTDLPIRVIATSRLHEIPDHIRLPDFRTIQLEPPSDHEKQQVLERLRLTRLSKDQRQRLEKASNWLVLMLETTAGESLKTVIRDNVNRLKRLDEAVYHAYEYLCFAGQYDVNVPEDLLLRLDSSGRFYRLYEKPAAAGLIFLETFPRWGNFLRPAHALIAETALKAYGRNPHVLFETMFAAVDGGKPANRMMLYGIMRNLIEEGAVALLEETLSRHSDHFAAMIEQGRHVEVFGVISKILKALKRLDLLKQAQQHVLESIPTNSNDWEAKFAFIRRNAPHLIPKTLIEAQQWLEVNVDATNVRASYLILLKEQDDDAQIEQALKSTTHWLRGHMDDVEVRRAYLNVVKEKGSPAQIAESLKTMPDWLDAHPDDVGVRSVFLNFVKEKGDGNQIAQAVEKARAWLESHADDADVRRTYLNLVKEKSSEEQIANAINATIAWLSNRDDDVEVRRTYLNLVKEKGSMEQIALAIEATIAWLSNRDDDMEIRTNYLNLVKDRGSEEQSAVAVEITRRWWNNSTKKPLPPLLYYYGSLLFQQGAFEEALSVLAEGVDRWKSNIPMRITYAWCLYELGEVEPALEALKQAHWRTKGKMPEMRNLTLRNLGTFYLRQGDHNRAISYLRQSLDVTEDAYKHWVHLEMGKTYLAAGQSRKALDHLRMALAGLDAVNHSETIKTVNELIAQAKGAL